MPFTSRFNSAAALARQSPFAVVDLSDPTALHAAVLNRAFEGELILFSFDFCGISEALSCVVSLRLVGFEHFLPLSDGWETCDAMQAAAGARGLAAIPCSFSSWPRDASGWTSWGSGPGCVSGARPSQGCVLEQLWTTRYHTSALILAMGINLLHVDTDSVILSDPYAVVKSVPLATHSLIFLQEYPANGGMWYAHNTSAGTGAHWVIAEVARRTLEVIDVPVPKRKKALPPFDQAILGDVLQTAAQGGRPYWGSACEHWVLSVSHLCVGANASRVVKAKQLPWQLHIAAPPTLAGAQSLRESLLGRRRRTDRDDLSCTFGTCRECRLRVLPLHVLGQARLETAISSPPWLFPNSWKAQQRGLYARRPAALAVPHLLGVRCRWCESCEDRDHGAKWEWMQLSGLWPSGAYTPAPALNWSAAVAAAGVLGLGGSLQSANRRKGCRQRMARTSYTYTHSSFAVRTQKICARRGRGRFLFADRPVLALRSQSAALLAAEAADDGGATGRVLMRRLLVLASVLGRIAVLPSFNCSAPWIRKVIGSDGFPFVHDLRVVVANQTAGAPVHKQRCAPCNVQFSCRTHVLSEAQLRAASLLPGAPSHVAVRLSIPMRRSDPTGSSERLASVIDLPALWHSLDPRLASGRRLGLAHVLVVSGLADVSADACSLDQTMLSEQRQIAAYALAVHCGVSTAWRHPSVICEKEEHEIATELQHWSTATAGAVGSVGGCGRSLLVGRLSYQCHDLLCSQTACMEHTVEVCAARLAGRGLIAESVLVRDRCAAWVRSLPAWLSMSGCNALTGHCMPPPDAHRGAVLWPAVNCIKETPGRMCADASTPAVCTSCWSRSA